MAELIILWAAAWLPAFMMAVGLTLGAMIALAMGELLREAWVEPLRPWLAAVARGAPILVPLALPLLVAGPALYPWAEGRAGGWFDPAFVVIRASLALATWIVLGRLLARPHVPRIAGGGALVLLLLTGAMAIQDWTLSRDIEGSGSLQALALLVEQTGAAIAIATLVALRRDMPRGEALTGLERALLSLAMAALWFRFTQFIVVYAADLPPEAAWYLRRSHGIWGWLAGFVALPMLLAAIALALVPQWRRWRLVAVSLLLLIQYGVQLVWVVGPVQQTPAATEAPLAAVFLMPAIVASVLIIAWSRLHAQTDRRV